MVLNNLYTLAQSIVTEETSFAGSNLLVIVTGLALCQGRRVETVLGTDPIPGAAIRQPVETLRTRNAVPKVCCRFCPALPASLYAYK